MEIKDFVLYHVATDKNLKVGDKFRLGGDSNGQEYNCLNLSFMKDGCPLYERGYEALKSDKQCDKDFVLEMIHALSNYDYILREFAIEYVRKEKFPDCLSRFKCAFLSGDKDSCLHFFDGALKKWKGQHFQALKIKVSGNAHFVKDGQIDKAGLSFAEYVSEALKFWGQDQQSSAATKEILFIGEAEVLEILDERKIN